MMKAKLYQTLTVLLVLLAFAPNTFAQDYTQLGLPEGAKVRLGKGWVGEIAYSPDGTRLAVASGIGIFLYDTQTCEELNLLTGHTSWGESVVFSPNGNTIASADGQEINFWDAHTGTQLRTLIGHTDWIESVAFSPDGIPSPPQVGARPSASRTQRREYTYEFPPDIQLRSQALLSVLMETYSQVRVGTGRCFCGRSSAPHQIRKR